ncbi:hypothetical protein [Magnetospira sp. QH-2]|uniref:hypothetical protein n=1 Tax=Magnetospira sp. (strain QH-2) TaxID=1288970 RepID=UPI0005FA4122|nr:hypothetical protein [Magnetospira sp. QH-2]
MKFESSDDIDANGIWTAPDGTKLDIHEEREKRGNPYWMPPMQDGPETGGTTPTPAPHLEIPAPGSHAHHEHLSRLQATDPDAYNALSSEIRAGNEAYWEHRQGGGNSASPNSNMAAQAEDPRHRQNSLKAAQQARDAHMELEKADWEKSFKEGLIKDYGLSETEAEAAAIMVSVTPVGTALDVGQGFVKAGVALSRGDDTAALEHLGKAGLSAAKIKKLDTLLKKGGGKLLAKVMPDVTSAWMARGLAKQGLAYDTVKESIGRALKSGANPAEALTYGVFSAHAKNSLNKAMGAYGRKWSKEALFMLSREQRDAVRAFATKDLVASGGKYLNDVSKEVQSRMVGVALDELFKPDQQEKDQER